MKSTFWGRWACVLAAGSGFAGVALAGATIVINNLDGAGEGLNDPTPFTPVGGNNATTLGQARLNVFQYAADFWGSYLNSSVTIEVDCNFDPLDCGTYWAVLGMCGPNTVHRDFTSVAPYPAPTANTYYVQALANAMHGSDLDPAHADIGVTYNSNLGETGCLSSYQWYYGLDGNAPIDTVDLRTVVLHELAHGLGFLSLVDLDTGEKLNGRNDVYIVKLERHGATPSMYPDMTDAQRVAASIADPNLHWVGAFALAEAAMVPLTAGFPSSHVQMHAPNPHEHGSSVSHFSDDLVPNNILEPSYTDPDCNLCLVLQLLRDLGWQMTVPSTDLYMRDTTSDVGEEPNPDTGDMWRSIDIYVRNTDDGLAAANLGVHQNPEYSASAPNYVYVRVHNRGCRAADGELKVYWAKASTGLSWDDDWVDAVGSIAGCTATLFGDRIDTASPLLINDLAPGAETIFEIPWDVPNPDDYACFGSDKGHFCLLARIETSGTSPYGMTYAEGANVGTNTRNNNNIVWKNVTVVDDVPGFTFGQSIHTVLIRSVEREDANHRFAFRVVGKGGSPRFFGSSAIEVDLGTELFDKWTKNQRQGEGVEVVGRSTLRLVSETSWIGGIVLKPREWHVLRWTFQTANRKDPGVPRFYDLEVRQYVVDLQRLRWVGGQIFEIDLNQIPLIPWGSVWRYFDRGGLPSESWAEAGFDDTKWKAGPAQLGFGDGDEATVIDGGPVASRHVTTYFRHSFNVDDRSFVRYLTFRLKRDDGAVVWLNGKQVYRNNLPDGAVGYNTPASATAKDDGTRIFTLTLPASDLLRGGTNVVAVEVHQAERTDDDLSFDLALQANQMPAPPEAHVTAPGDGSQVERGSVALRAAASDSDGSVVSVEFYIGTVKVGEDDTPPYTASWVATVPGAYGVIARAIDNVGLSFESQPVIVTVLGPRLEIARDGSKVIATWTGQGVLQQSPNVVPGNWSDVPNSPASPYVITPTSRHMYYRLR